MSFRLATALSAGTAVSACVATPDPIAPAAAQRVLRQGSGSSPAPARRPAGASLPLVLRLLPQAARPSRRRRSPLPRPRRVRLWMNLWSQHRDAASLRPSQRRRRAAASTSARRSVAGPSRTAHSFVGASEDDPPRPAVRPVTTDAPFPRAIPAPTCQRRRVVCRLARRSFSPETHGPALPARQRPASPGRSGVIASSLSASYPSSAPSPSVPSARRRRVGDALPPPLAPTSATAPHRRQDRVPRRLLPGRDCAS